MTEPAFSGTTVAGLTLAGIMTAMPFGISVGTIAIGTGFSIIGVIGRAAFELQKSSEGPGGMALRKIVGWVGAGFIGAPFMTILYLVFLNLIKVQSDGVLIIGLMFFGFSGPRMVTWFMNLLIGMLNKRLGINIPNLGTPAQPDPVVKP